MEEIHPDLEQIIRDAGIKIEAEEKQSILNDFKKIEELLNEEQGDPDGITEIYSVTVSEHPSGKQYLNARLAAKSSDTYQVLGSPMLGTMLAEEEGNVGLLLRVGAYYRDNSRDYASDKISDDPDGESILCAAVTGSFIAYCLRNRGQEPIYEIKSLEEWTPGESRLLDAMLLSFMGPRYMKDKFPHIYEGVLRELEEHIKKQREQDNDDQDQ